jgi:hypothetical protein
LAQEHRPELAGADQTDAHWLSGGGALLQQAVEVHGYSAAALPAAARA